MKIRHAYKTLFSKINLQATTRPQQHQLQPSSTANSHPYLFNHSFESLLSAKDFEFHPIAATTEMMVSRKRRVDWSEDALSDFSDISSSNSSSPKAPMFMNKEQEDDPVYGNENVASNFTQVSQQQKRFNNFAKGQPAQGNF